MLTVSLVCREGLVSLIHLPDMIRLSMCVARVSLCMYVSFGAFLMSESQSICVNGESQSACGNGESLSASSLILIKIPNIYQNMNSVQNTDMPLYIPFMVFGGEFFCNKTGLFKLKVGGL